jgi:hypothetical protein
MKTSGSQHGRTDTRIRVGLPLRLRFGWNDCEEVKASIVDMSERGLCVRWRAPLRLGMEVKAILESAPDDVKVYRVLWVRKAEPPEHGYDIGLERKL